MDKDWHDVMRRSSSSDSESESNDEREQYANMILSMQIPAVSYHELHQLELREIKEFDLLKWVQDDNVKVVVVLFLVVVYWNLIQNLKSAMYLNKTQ